MLIVIFLVIFSGVIGAVASGQNRSGIGWFFISMLLSPLVAGILLAVVGEA